jgi:hypothetical protein
LAVTDVSEKPAVSIFRDEEHAASDCQQTEHGHFCQQQQQSAAACCHCSTDRQTDRQTQFIQPILSRNKEDYARKELTYVTFKRKYDSIPQKSLLYCSWSRCGLYMTISREDQ